MQHGVGRGTRFIADGVRRAGAGRDRARRAIAGGRDALGPRRRRRHGRHDRLGCVSSGGRGHEGGRHAHLRGVSWLRRVRRAGRRRERSGARARGTTARTDRGSQGRHAVARLHALPVPRPYDHRRARTRRRPRVLRRRNGVRTPRPPRRRGGAGTAIRHRRSGSAPVLVVGRRRHVPPSRSAAPRTGTGEREAHAVGLRHG